MPSVRSTKRLRSALCSFRFSGPPRTHVTRALENGGSRDRKPARRKQLIKDITVAAEVRTIAERMKARAVRAKANASPPWFYGAYQDPVSAAVNPRRNRQIIRSSTGFNTIFKLAIAGGETTPVMIVDRQVDPIKSTLLHADLKRKASISPSAGRIRVAVPVFTEGEPRRRQGPGRTPRNHHRSIEISASP